MFVPKTFVILKNVIENEWKNGGCMSFFIFTLAQLFVYKYATAKNCGFIEKNL